MLKACFVGNVSPQRAESILIKTKPGSYVVRQSDIDPDLLLLSYVTNDIKPCVKHVIVPEFQASYSVKLAWFKKRLQDESEEVEKFLESFGCSPQLGVTANFLQKEDSSGGWGPSQVFSVYI